MREIYCILWIRLPTQVESPLRAVLQEIVAQVRYPPPSTVCTFNTFRCSGQVTRLLLFFFCRSFKGKRRQSDLDATNDRYGWPCQGFSHIEYRPRPHCNNLQGYECDVKGFWQKCEACWDAPSACLWHSYNEKYMQIQVQQWLVL